MTKKEALSTMKDVPDALETTFALWCDRCLPCGYSGPNDTDYCRKCEESKQRIRNVVQLSNTIIEALPQNLYDNLVAVWKLTKE